MDYPSKILDSRSKEELLNSRRPVCVRQGRVQSNREPNYSSARDALDVAAGFPGAVGRAERGVPGVAGALRARGRRAF